MDKNQSDRVLAFDSLFTTNHIQMLKILLGYMEPTVQGKLAVYIKFQELQYTLQLISAHPNISLSPCFKGDRSNLSTLLDEILFFCDPIEREKFQNLKNMFQSFESMQEMLELLREMAPEMFSGDGTGGIDLSQMMNMSQGTDMSQMMEMMNMMQGMFADSNEINQNQKET